MALVCAGKLHHVDKLSPLPLEQGMINCGLLRGREVDDAAEFIRACLHLNPNERFSAADLEDHRWLDPAFMSCQAPH